MPDLRSGTITAVLGPTNTGKTFLAMDRMLSHPSGMIGFPLRLLARENYDKAVATLGPRRVALITGEEKILPPGATHFICTVESMPVDRMVDFLAVDEIQLCADPFRGHVFTDRLLHARGRAETMFLGSEALRGLIARLVPGVEFVSRPRFSKLRYAGAAKLTRLPKRSAIVAFSLSEVYGIAEFIRRQRGGAAVVMGALSPRTRNAQVALYQNGEVDYLVATDAIGMGLNMDVDHVAFASLSKFDGRRPRDLTAPEVAQIAGRAGRHMNDGTFGTSVDAPPLDAEIIDRVETHSFAPVKQIHWRNPDLMFTTVEALHASLNVRPDTPGLMRPRPPDDQQILDVLTANEDIRARAKGIDRVRQLWEVCQIPDFRKLLPASHARLLAQVYRHLTDSHGVLPADWVAKQVAALDRADGDMHALMDRIAAIRVWTFIANRGRWLADPAHWQGLTRGVEDRLSDALHERLSQQFIDKRTAVLVKKLREDAYMAADVHEDGSVFVDGHRLGRLEGLAFAPEQSGNRRADRAVINAAERALRRELRQRVSALQDSTDDTFSLNQETAAVSWNGTDIATLAPGADPYAPQLTVIADEQVDADARAKVLDRARGWLTTHIAEVLGPLMAARAAEEFTPPARGLVFALAEQYGNARRRDLEGQITSLTEDDRRALARAGIRFGVFGVFMPDLLKDKPVQLLALLWRVANGRVGTLAAPPSGRVSFETDPDVPAAYYACAGYRAISGRAYRVDMVERFAAEARGVLRTAREDAKAEQAKVAQTTKPAEPVTEPAGETTVGEAPTETAPAEAVATDPAPAAEAATPKAVAPEAPAAEAVAPEEPASDAPAPGTETSAPAPEAAPSDSASTPAEPAPSEPAPTAPAKKDGLFLLPPEKLSLLGVDAQAGGAVLTALGYRMKLEPELGLYFAPKPGFKKSRNRPDQKAGSTADHQRGDHRKAGPHKGKGPRRDGHKDGHKPRRDGGKGGGKHPHAAPARKPREKEPDPDSPFAVLKSLIK